MDNAIWNRLQMYALRTPGPSKSMIVAETVLTLPWTMLFEVVCKCTHYPLQDYQNPWLQLGRCLHCHGQCHSKSFANVHITHSGTITIYDYSWDSAYIVMDYAISNRLQMYALSIPGPSTSMIIAETVLALSWTMQFEIVCKCTHCPLQDYQNLWL